MSETVADFLGYPSAGLTEALFSIIPAPYEETVTYAGGQAAAPWKILEASSLVQDYDEETALSLVDMNSVHVVPPDEAPEDATAMESWVKGQIRAALDATAVPVIVGGEGTVTLWGVETLLPRCPELSVLHIDAHADLAEAEDGEENHHTVMRRVLELSPVPTICQVGIRSLTRDGFERIMDGGQPVEAFFMADIDREADESWHERVVDELRSPVYVSLDLTGFDPGVIPAVGNPEPGGLQWWPVLRLLKKVAARRRIAAFDVTELSPREGLVRSDYTAARLIYKMMNYIQAGGKMLAKPDEAKA